MNGAGGGKSLAVPGIHRNSTSGLTLFFKACGNFLTILLQDPRIFPRTPQEKDQKAQLN